MSRFYLVFPLILQTLIWIPTRFFFWFFLHAKIEGLENLKGIKGGVIFAQNHTSELDVFVVPSSLPFLSYLMPMFYTSREKTFYKRSGWRQKFYGGLFFQLWGAHRVLVGVNDYKRSLKTHVEILKHGKSLCIFPEGTRSKDGKVGPAKGGVAFLSHVTGVPIVPVGVTGLLNPSAKDIFSRKRKVVFRFGKPLYYKDLFSGVNISSGQEYKKIASKVTERMKTLVDL